ncbi:MAG: hypothetical protein OXH79_11700 [Boseongicola sp.]|nr:hypothetical protein [Boseongicola sp.]
MTQKTAAMLGDWFDIAAPGVIMCGRTQRPVALTADFLRSRVAGTALPIPVYIGHEAGKPVAQVVALRVDESRYCQIQARLGNLDPAFVRECARGRWFGRSPLVKGRGIKHLAFAGMDDIPGSVGLWPTHFIDPAAFDGLDGYVAACSAADRHRAHAELIVLNTVYSHRPQDVRDPGAPGFQAIFAKTSSASPPPSPQNTWGYDAPGIAAYISEGNEALFSRGGNSVAAGSEPDNAWEPYTGGVRGGRTWSTNVPGGSGPLWKSERKPLAGTNWGAAERLTITGSASTVWFDAAPVLSLDEYLWMAQRRVQGAPQVGAAVRHPFTSPRSISRLARDGEDGVTTTITRTETIVADTSKYYDQIRVTGYRSSSPHSQASANINRRAVHEIQGVEETQQDGTRLWLRWTYIDVWERETSGGGTDIWYRRGSFP